MTIRSEGRSGPGISSGPAPRFEHSEFIARGVRDIFSRLMAEVSAGIALRYPDVTPAQNSVMVMIDRDGSRITDLARRAQMTKQAMAEAVAGLEARGFVERRPDPTDGRARLVTLTDEGWEALRYGFSVALAIHEHWESLIGPAKMKRLMALLRELVTKLDAESDDE